MLLFPSSIFKVLMFLSVDSGSGCSRAGRGLTRESPVPWSLLYGGLWWAAQIKRQLWALLNETFINRENRPWGCWIIRSLFPILFPFSLNWPYITNYLLENDLVPNEPDFVKASFVRRYCIFSQFCLFVLPKVMVTLISENDKNVLRETHPHL